MWHYHVVLLGYEQLIDLGYCHEDTTASKGIPTILDSWTARYPFSCPLLCLTSVSNCDECIIQPK